MCPGARQLGAGGILTILRFVLLGAVAPGARFLHLNERVCQVH
jgi:hypothetical protein